MDKKKRLTWKKPPAKELGDVTEAFKRLAKSKRDSEFSQRIALQRVSRPSLN
jgi:hypothetical protein